MKNIKDLRLIIVALLIANVSFISAQSLSHNNESSLYKHLLEVNKEWQYFQGELDVLQTEVNFKSDNLRIQTHLRLVHQLLVEKNNQSLNKSQDHNRHRLLSVLKEYYQAGIFPINDHHSQRQPYFVDAHQTACAVGYLLLADGQDELVRQISAENNYAYLAELTKLYPVINSWANTNGFTLDELAWIQPNYSPAPQQWFPVGGDNGIEGRINVMKANADGNLLYMAGDFTAVDEVQANSIIAWDGANWHTLGEGVSGEILAIATNNSGDVYIGGNFTLNSDNQYTNIAMWDGTNWTGLQQGDMLGSVKTIYVAGTSITVGGDFEMIDGQPISHLAKKSFWQQESPWNNYASINLGGGVYDTIYNAFAVNGPVNAIQKVETRLLIAGEFTQTAPDVTDPLIQQIETDYMAYWFFNNWELGFYGPYEDVVATAYDESKIYTGGDEYSVSTFTAGIWEDQFFSTLDTANSESLVHGFLRHSDKFYVYGNIIKAVIGGTISQGLTQIGGVFNSGQFNGGGATFDKTVRACEVFQDNIYFAGDFTWAGNTDNTFNGLTYSPFTGIPGNTSDAYFKNLTVYCHNKQLNIEYEQLSNSTALYLYNVDGQTIRKIDLAPGSSKFQQDLSDLTSGIYFYELVDGTHRGAGKIGVY